MNSVQTTLLTPHEFHQQMELLGKIPDEQAYGVTTDLQGNYTVVVDPVKPITHVSVCQVFWHFLTQHKEYILIQDAAPLSTIYKQITKEKDFSEKLISLITGNSLNDPHKSKLLFLINKIFDGLEHLTGYPPLAKLPPEAITRIIQTDPDQALFLNLRLVCKRIYAMLPLGEFRYTSTFKRACENNPISVNQLAGLFKHLNLGNQPEQAKALLSSYLPDASLELRERFFSKLFLEPKLLSPLFSMFQTLPDTVTLPSFGWYSCGAKPDTVLAILHAVRQRWPGTHLLRVRITNPSKPWTPEQNNAFITCCSNFTQARELVIEREDRLEYEERQEKGFPLSSLANLTNLSHLGLAYINSFDVSSAFQALSNLKSLSIIESTVTRGRIAIDAIQNAPPLTFLKVEGNIDITNPAFCQALLKHKDLKTLILIPYDKWEKRLKDHQFLGTIDFMFLQDLFTTHKELKQLSLYSDKLYNEIAIDIGKCSSLTTLELKISDTVTFDTLSALLQLPKLQCLHLKIDAIDLSNSLDFSKIAYSSISTLHIVIEKKKTKKIDVVELERQLENLMRAIKVLPKLTSLTIVSNHFNSGSASLLLEKKDPLQSLTIVCYNQPSTHFLSQHILQEMQRTIPHFSIQSLDTVNEKIARIYTVSYFNKFSVDSEL